MNEHLRSAILALQFLTRFPTPQLKDFRPEELTKSAIWFPAVGLLIGALLAVVLDLFGKLDPWAAAALTLVFWVWITGALHLDGLSDLADAIGAAHRDPARFHAVLKDPHTGTFGAVVTVLQLAVKLVFLMLLAEAGMAWVLLAICAWARLGPLAWSLWLPVLKLEGAGASAESGTGERFAWAIEVRHVFIWAVLLAPSILLSPALLVAPLAVAGWWLFLKMRLGGQTGDCLGAGIEIAESASLACFVLLLLAGA
jgi:adenosylcobinamide-GDP ribazoletransferase